jgi:predicted RNA polymerase sigma factor
LQTSRQAVEAVWRIESARIVGALARYTGDFAMAEDLAQEALAEALVSWPRDGVPRSPSGWLLTVGRRRAIDAFRRRSALDERYAVLAAELGEGQGASGSTPGGSVTGEGVTCSTTPSGSTTTSSLSSSSPAIRCSRARPAWR